MAVQFNLLPDVKLEFDRQQRTKRLVYTLTILITGGAVALLVASFIIVNVLQGALLGAAKDDIDKYSKQLKSIPDIEKVLTVQNQLNALPQLHKSKHITSRFFTYLPQITPKKVFVGQTALDFSANTIVINGTADSLESVNAFVDTLKFTNYKIGDSDQKQLNPAFSSVILTSNGRTDKGATYTISASFDPILFDGTKNVVLVIPDKVTTRSVTESPDINNLLFDGQNSKPEEQQNEGQ